jgi:sialate O-acetylesterase
MISNKQEVGRRLALWALANDYGKTDLVFSGPLYQSMNIVDDYIVLEFDHIGSGLKSNDGKPLNWFEIAGADGKFVKATAVITGHTVIVSNPDIKNPAAVRFGWHEEAEPNFVNQENLPASPFNTQSW